MAAEAYSAAVVSDAWDETPMLRAVRLRLPDSLARAHVAPGQVVKVRAGGGEGYFAIASAPDGAEIELLLKRGATVADAAISAAKPGGALEVTAPLGKGFPVAPARDRDVLLFAAGSGIAPIRTLVQWLAAHPAEHGPAVLFYGQRGEGEFAYAGEHARWEAAGVRVVLCASGMPIDEERGAWDGMRGRVHEVAKSIAFGGARPHHAVAYVAGMKKMVEDVKATLSAAGLPVQRVYLNW